VGIVELVLEVHDHLRAGDIDHAFGGALALAYYAEPRGTADVDVNVFVPFASAGDVVAGFGSLGLHAVAPAQQWVPVAGVTLARLGDPITLDLFFSVGEHYDEIARRKRRFPFASEGRKLPFLSVEDLAMFKLSFGRDQDWVDLRRLVSAHPEVDLSYVERQLIGIRGSTMYPRLARLRVMMREAEAGQSVHRSRRRRPLG